jgi:hypothetical protein
MGEGASSIEIPIVSARPEPPDITVLGRVPGGVLFPCTPTGYGQETVNRNQYRVSFPEGQGVKLLLRRIQLMFSVILLEDEFENSTAEEHNQTYYLTPAEAMGAWEGAGGRQGENSSTEKPITLSSPFEETKTKHEFVNLSAARIIEEVKFITIRRSVLPITLTMAIRLYGPDGLLWGESMEVPMRPVATNKAGFSTGVGRVDSYIDLTNPIALQADRIYGLQFLVMVPSTALSDPQIGVENKKGAIGGIEVGPGEGSVSLWYDIETGPVNK